MTQVELAAGIVVAVGLPTDDATFTLSTTTSMTGG